MMRWHYYRISLLSYLIMYYIVFGWLRYVLQCFCFLKLFWYPCMAINVKCTVLRWAFPRHHTVNPMLPPSGNPFKCHEDVLYYSQPMIPPKRFDISPLCEMLRRSRDAFRFFVQHMYILLATVLQSGLVHMYIYSVCMYGPIYSKSPARGQLNKKNEYSPVRVRA